MAYLLEGPVHSFKGRHYLVVTVPFSRARLLFRPDLYHALSGAGEQRPQAPAHVRKLRRETEAGCYTPAACHAALREHHREGLDFSPRGGQDWVRLRMEEDDYLPLTDGGHRFTAWGNMMDDGDPDAPSFPVTMMVALDGDPQKDFENLQKGRSLDPAHRFSLRVLNADNKGAEAAALAMGFGLARDLNDDRQGPFFKQIKFDGRSLAPLPISTVCACGGSDRSWSLAGFCRLLMQTGRQEDAGLVPSFVRAVVSGLENHAPELLEHGSMLSPPPDGSKGSATMLVGLAMQLYHRVRVRGHRKIQEDDLAALVAAARMTLSAPPRGNFSGPAKRLHLGAFAQAFFKDVGCDKHDGVPRGLVEALSPSALGLTPLPRAAKPKAPPKKKQLAATA